MRNLRKGLASQDKETNQEISPAHLAGRDVGHRHLVEPQHLGLYRRDGLLPHLEPHAHAHPEELQREGARGEEIERFERGLNSTRRRRALRLELLALVGAQQTASPLCATTVVLQKITQYQMQYHCST